LAYQPPANRIFLSEQTSHPEPASSTFSQNKPAPAISHQPNEQAAELCPDLGTNPEFLTTFISETY
jgi:hypothetical protein